ncbi:MAG: 3-dehydroquinate synthase [Balneolaceae bacterium]
MKSIKQKFSISFEYPVTFTEALFHPENHVFADLVRSEVKTTVRKVLFVIDKGMVKYHPELFERIKQYHSRFKEDFSLIPAPVYLPGGEAAKNDSSHVREILDVINRANMDRHSFIAAVGGGAVIDTAGYAASIAHRGLRMIRIPTTVLAQNDAAVGVKNGINDYGKKNFLGTFDPPYAVVNDTEFLETLDDRDWRSGISEAIKVALIKDTPFFEFLEQQAHRLNERDMESMNKLIYRCAELHLEHISTSGDPFERGSSRPLDFGHWAAHKLEQITRYDLRHGEAVAIGIALDTTYSYLSGLITEPDWIRVLNVLKSFGFLLFVPELEQKLDEPADQDSIFNGLEEFREHLGGELTIMLLKGIGDGIEVNQVDYELYRKAVDKIRAFETIESEQ